MALSPRHKFVSLLLALAGIGGFVLLLALAAHHPAAAPILRILALLWLIAAGASKLVFDLTESAGPPSPHRPRTPQR
ncbi:MAG: hypothetical protein H7236_06555 [Gemmatimonadaceae bacterium]|nr:hypothetical protein [Caulobacter sp.]